MDDDSALDKVDMFFCLHVAVISIAKIIIFIFRCTDITVITGGSIVGIISRFHVS